MEVNELDDQKDPAIGARIAVCVVSIDVYDERTPLSLPAFIYILWLFGVCVYGLIAQPRKTVQTRFRSVLAAAAAAKPSVICINVQRNRVASPIHLGPCN